jgi:hypothetical protein
MGTDEESTAVPGPGWSEGDASASRYENRVRRLDDGTTVDYVLDHELREHGWASGAQVRPNSEEGAREALEALPGLFAREPDHDLPPDAAAALPRIGELSDGLRRFTVFDKDDPAATATVDGDTPGFEKRVCFRDGDRVYRVVSRPGAELDSGTTDPTSGSDEVIDSRTVVVSRDGADDAVDAAPSPVEDAVREMADTDGPDPNLITNANVYATAADAPAAAYVGEAAPELTEEAGALRIEPLGLEIAEDATLFVPEGPELPEAVRKRASTVEGDGRMTVARLSRFENTEELTEAVEAAVGGRWQERGDGESEDGRSNADGQGPGNADDRGPER